MTGILPIKKDNTGSALNMFREYTMLDPKKLGPFFGFTEDEMKILCSKAGRDVYKRQDFIHCGHSGAGWRDSGGG